MTDPAMIVRRLEPGDIGEVAAALAAAFDDDPAYVYLFPDRNGRREGLHDLFAGNLRTHLPYRCTYVGVVAGSAVATVTIRPPDGFSISLVTMIRRGLLPFAVAHGPRAVRRLLTVKATYEAIEARLSRGERHWYVHMMAVDPRHQGKGFGAQLLHHALQHTADGGMIPGTPPIVLTTHKDRNVVFYERAGFVLDEVEDVVMNGGTPYPVWRMRRTSARP
jgi:GNAT superfamily N-acetyltransferase